MKPSSGAFQKTHNVAMGMFTPSHPQSDPHASQEGGESCIALVKDALHANILQVCPQIQWFSLFTKWCYEATMC